MKTEELQRRQNATEKTFGGNSGFPAETLAQRGQGRQRPLRDLGEEIEASDMTREVHLIKAGKIVFAWSTAARLVSRSDMTQESMNEKEEGMRR